MISGDKVITTNSVLMEAVSSSVRAGSFRASKELRQLAIDNEVELLRYHRAAGHQTDLESARSKRSEDEIMNQQRRFTVEPGYFSVAPLTAAEGWL